MVTERRAIKNREGTLILNSLVLEVTKALWEVDILLVRTSVMTSKGVGK